MKLLMTLALCIGILAIYPTSSARGDEWNHKTILTFSEPVEVPGVVLPAGKYVFRLADSQANRHIVQILNDRENKVFATLLTVPSERMRTPEKTIITFDERPAGSPEAVRAWYYPGDNTGEEFVYPKGRAMELAKSNRQPVKAMPVEMTQNITMPTAPDVSIATQPHLVELQSAPVQIAQPKGDDVEIVEIGEVILPDRLPDTATNLPLILLGGIMALAAGAISLLRPVVQRWRS